jgi:osmotically-inducible protein OsmY
MPFRSASVSDITYARFIFTARSPLRTPVPAHRSRYQPKEKSMKRRQFLVLAAAVAAAGCAGSRTRESTGEYLDDASITAKVKTALLQDEVVKGLDIQVETFKRTVQLSGFVNAASEKQRAEAIARDVAGVRFVKNDIRVKQ